MGDLDKARQLLEEMKQTTTTASASSSTDSSSSFRNKPTKSSSSSLLLSSLPSSGFPASVVIRPNLVTYNTFLNACQLAGDLDAALLAKQDMEQAGIRPDTTTYTTLIATVARKKSCTFGERDPSLAFILLDEMKHMSRRSSIDGSYDDRLSPNGKTYSALIDACGRCGRPDLALQGLRIMLRQKSRQEKRFQKQQQKQNQPHQKQQHQQQERFALQNEVGAWTAAINACGKADRLRTAMRLFSAMPKLGCEPNAVTCGCLTDSLLRAGHVDDALQVLRYMKEKGIVPSEVMYTSLMTRANRLAQMENKQQKPSSISLSPLTTNTFSSLWYPEDAAKYQSTAADTKAISVYTELMRSLMDGRLSSTGKNDNKTGNTSRKWSQQLNEDTAKTTDHEALLLKVFLVFQQMKASGAEPDLACYNALLRACARAGDLRRGLNVLQEMMQGNSASSSSNSYSAKVLQPNDRSWRELLRATRTSDQAVSVWKLGLGYHERQRQHQHGQSHSNSDAFGISRFGRGGSSSSSSDEKEAKWKPSSASFAALVAAHLQEADSLTSNSTVDNHQKRKLHARVVALYDGVLRGTNQKLGLDRMNVMELLDDQGVMVLILRAIVSLDDLFLDDLDNNDINRGGGTSVVINEERRKLRSRATSILQLECFREIIRSPSHQRWRSLRLPSYRAVEKAQSWMTTTNPPHVKEDDFLPEWTDLL